MEIKNTLLFRFETLVVLLLSLALGYLLLRVRDAVFGDVYSDKSSNIAGEFHVDFKKKIEQEEELNLNELWKKSQ